jgi:hypothetical protein
MNRLLWGVALLVAALVFWQVLDERGDYSIEYRGQRIKLAKSYDDYDDYKNDPTNLDPSEIGRVQQLVRSAPMARSFKTWNEATHAVGEVVFPGYGMGSMKSNRPELRAFAIEIPYANQERIFVFKPQGSGWTLVGDFIGPTDLAIGEVREEAGKLVFRNRKGELVTVHPNAASADSSAGK